MRSPLALCTLAVTCLLAPESSPPREPDATHPAGLLPSVMRALQDQDDRYRARPIASDAGEPIYTARNPAHGFDIRFDDNGVALHVADQPALQMRVARVRVGGDHAEEVRLAPWITRDGRIERSALTTTGLGLTEWYLNAPIGFEQGFTVTRHADQPARGRSHVDSLAVAIDIGAAWIPQLESDGHIRLDSAGGARLRYGQLSAWDLTGRSLPARLAVAGPTITLHVDTAGAEYPITIDPFIQQTQLLSPDGDPFENFGWSAAVSGDTALVTAPLDFVGPPFSSFGAGYVFTRSGATWTLQARLAAAGAFAMGMGAALDGDIAVLGAPAEGGNRGAAYIFARSGTTWSLQARVVASDGVAGDSFGSSVDVSGNTVLVAAQWDNDFQGSAYVFVRTGSTWTQQAKLVAGDGAFFDIFGSDVAVDGDTALVGVVFDDVGTTPNKGSVRVFTRSGTTWTQQAQLTAADGAANDLFGVSVALDGDLALVGAHQDDIGAVVDQGSAYVFVRSGGSWSQEAKLVASDPSVSDRFGQFVALSGELAVVGTIWDNASQGSADVFARDGGAWPRVQRLVASDAAAGDLFSNNVSVSGTTILVSAYQNDIGGETDQGSAYVFEFVRSGVPPPGLTEIIPNTGSTAGGTAVTLRGSDFSAQGTVVTFDGVPATNLVVVNSSTMTAVTPAHAAGSVNVTVRHGDGQTSTLPGGFTYIAPPPTPPAATTLTVGLRGTGQGRVVSAPAGIACGTDCTETYNTAAVVQLIAIPAADANFGGWIGDADCADGSVTMSANRTCNARFERLPEGRTLDLNGDGLGDLLGYAPSASPGAGGAINSVRSYSGVFRAGDVNGDRRSDLLAYDPVTGFWSLEVNGVTALTGTAGPQQSPLVFDVNGDTLADIVFHDPVSGQVTPCLPAPGGLQCRPPAAITLNTALFPMDLNGDGRGDLLAYRWATGETSFLLGDGGGGLSPASQTLAAPANQHIVVFDSNGDRRSDLIFSDPVSGAGTLFTNTGGGFTPTPLGASVAGFALRAANLDGDARGDLIAYNAATGQTLQALNTGSGFTVTSSTLPAGRTTVAVSDLNGDGRSDLVLYDANTGAVTFAISQANGSFTQQHAAGPPGLMILAQAGAP